ncbi:hypothetical protein ACLQ8T_06255 [Glutamicibacter sp. FR1]|uniref:hypothetical protein n=1 Tax=Glutamicibacter sp. FR1 TaxID=3393744 RepID=UPI0039B07E86
MTELVALPTRYPEDKPWFDIQAFLAPGLVPRFAGACAAQVDGNTINYAVRILIPAGFAPVSAGGGWVIMQGLPPELRVGAAVVGIGAYNITLTQVVADTAGRIVIPTRTGQNPANETEIGFMLTGWRRG